MPQVFVGEVVWIAASHVSEVKFVVEMSTVTLEPILAEDSTITKLVPSLEGILKDLEDSAKHHDYLVALLIVFLAESGFQVSTDERSSQRQSLRSLHIPDNWKSEETGVYDVNVELTNVPDVKCKLIAIPLGDTLILNFFPLVDNRNIYCISVQTLKYVNPFSSDLCGKYRNLKEISHRFKDSIATPVRLDVSIRAGLMCPGLQGLPVELKLKILSILDVYERKQMAQCSSEFNRLCSDPQFRKRPLRKDLLSQSYELISKCQSRHYTETDIADICAHNII
ncbi:PREDICTED: uncharacterized protein LOC107190036 [Dufourea novaeangliae]|uniref:uncharacterized protein LOC107190036 n=1 Tax=Dufourea novaeangliae TaxID=178035 RepID=UPI0007679556|nr:PREDICTED: uncharacterized protein LOC107190036 [Dufourea novaeangliae]